MKNLYRFLMTFVFLTAFTLAAQAQGKPDLIITNASVIKNTEGYIGKVTVTVMNFCQAAPTGNSYVLLKFKAGTSGDRNAETLYQIGVELLPLKGGESVTKTFEIKDKKIGANRFILVEADPYKKVAEADENNNWRTLNPNGAGPKLSGQFQCSPKE